MDLTSWTAINAFGDSGAARRASARLVERGFSVVLPGRLGELAICNDSVAIVGAASDHERMIAMTTRLQNRVAALAVVGGPLAVLLDRYEGLTVPTLVVSDRVGRHDRRRVARRLPRGSMLVRAADFEAAMDAVVSFLQCTVDRIDQQAGSKNLRPMVLRLAPAALFVPTAAVVLAGSGAAASGACTPQHEVGSGLLTITCDGNGVTLSLATDAGGLIMLDGESVAKLSEIQKISILTTGGDDTLTLDETFNKFRSPDDIPIVFELAMGEGLDEHKWIGSSGDDSFKLTAAAIDVPGGDEFEHKIFGVESFNFILGAGEDTFDGGTWKLKIAVDGGQGTDNLIGGLGPDVFTLSTGGDFLDGKEGFDTVKIETDESLLKITDSTIALTDLADTVAYKQMEALEFRGSDATASKIEVADFSGLLKLDLDGGGGGDDLKLTTGLPAVQLHADKISLFDDAQKLLGDIKYAGFETFRYVGDDSANKFEIAGLKFNALDLDGGGGGDTLKLESADGLIGITDTTISLNFSKIDIDHKEFSELSVIGDETAGKIEVANFSGLLKLDLDGGGGGDDLKLTTGSPAVQLHADKISLFGDAQKLLGDIKYAGFETFRYVGDDSANKFEIAGLKFNALDLDGGGGGDTLKLESADGLIGITDTTISLNFSKIDIDHKEFSELSVIGDETAGKIEVANFSGLLKLDLDGGGGGDELKFSTGESLLKITDASLAPGNLSPIAHKGFDLLSVIAVSDVAHTFDGSKVTMLKLALHGGSNDDILLGGSLDDLLTGGLGNNLISGGGGTDTLAEAVDGNFVASSSTLAGAGIDAFSSIEELHLTGGAGDNSFNTEPFKGRVTIDGGAGNDRMISGPGADVLIGGDGNDSLNGGQGADTLRAGEGDDTLHGGPGTDFGDGGNGIDTGKSIENAQNIER